MDRVKGKIAVVTAAANGIGRAIGERLAAEGAWVLVTDIEDEAGGAAVEEIQKNGGRAEYLHADAGSPADAARAIATAARQNGRVDILCNNAAYLGPVHAAAESTAEEWDKCLRVGILGT